MVLLLTLQVNRLNPFLEKNYEPCINSAHCVGFVVNERDELWASIRIFEIANTIPTMRHFVYSSLDYFLQMENFNHKYAVHHANAKGRFHTYLQGMQSPAHTSSKLAWSVLLTVAYNEDLMGGPCVPRIDADGTRIFKMPLGTGRMPWITLSDLGVFALKIFQDPEYWSGRTLGGVSHFITGTEMAETLSRVAGVDARYEAVTYDEWVAELPFRDLPVAQDDPDGIKHGENFRMWWPCWEDGTLDNHRDMAELKNLHPGLQSFEGWVRETDWNGTARPFMKLLMDAGVTAEMHQPTQ